MTQNIVNGTALSTPPVSLSSIQSARQSRSAPTITGFDLPHLSSSHQLQRVLASALGRPSIHPDAHPKAAVPWDARSFSLDLCSAFQDATPEAQHNILHLAGQTLLAEAYAIEKAGVGYMSHMTLLAESTEERMLYGLFSADETTHLSQLMPYVENPDLLDSEDPFLALLETVLSTGDRTTLLFVIQVVLEGWGLTHYRKLARQCQYPPLADLLRSFLDAESRHHGAGVVLFQHAQISSRSRRLILETLASFLRMIQVGPQRLLESVAHVKGGMTRSQRITFLSEINTERHSGERLQLLRSLILPLAPSIATTLTEHHLFDPLPPEKCV